MKTTRYFLCALFVLLCFATVALAQDEEINQYYSAFSGGKAIIMTIMWCVAYMLIYAGALVVTLAYLRLFEGFETETYWWILLLWGAGMVINTLAYRITPIPWIAALICLPIIFGWTLFISTRSFADLTVPDAIRVAVVVAICCAPYFGPTILLPPRQPKVTSMLWQQASTSAAARNGLRISYCEQRRPMLYCRYDTTGNPTTHRST